MPCRMAPRTARQLLEQSARCRRLAAATTDAVVSRRLLDLAVELEEMAKMEEKRERERE